MIVNLFSIFDPSISIFSLSLVVLFFPIFILRLLENSRNYFYFLECFILKILFREGKQILRRKFRVLHFLLSLFFFILFFNLSSLFSFIFPAASHIVLVFPLGLIFCLTPVIRSILNKFNYFISSLLPQGTPYLLIPFIVVIELVSLTIRPITLSVRLTANITAGHLLISILISFLTSISFNPFSFFPSLIIRLLELGVALIQSYVFFTLLNIYSSER